MSFSHVAAANDTDIDRFVIIIHVTLYFATGCKVCMLRSYKATQKEEPCRNSLSLPLPSNRKYLENQWIEINGSRVRLCGGFGIFGHGNVTCLGEALYEARDSLPFIVGSMNRHGFAAAAYAKSTYGSGLCFASAGPGTANLVTSALAMANRLPILLL